MLHQRVKGGGSRGGGEDNEAPVSIMQRPAEVVVSQRAGARRPGSSSWRYNLLEWGDLGQVLCTSATTLTWREYYSYLPGLV